MSDKPMTVEKKKLIVIGAGGRGKRYTDISMDMDGYYEVVAVAEPMEARRNYMKKAHNLPDEMCFDTWEPLLAMPKIADAAIIATMDRDHVAPALAAIEKGYDLLLEKPIAPTPEDCRAVERAAKEKGVSVLVCHVLRYSPHFCAIKRVLDSGALGEVVSIEHNECVGYIHHSHSFVRGNWSNSDKSSCMILQKSCHDMDILQWLIGKPCVRVHSFGSLSFFKEDNAPEGAPEFCYQGCPEAETCPYHAEKLYLHSKTHRRALITGVWNPTDEQVAEALRTTNYGRCVYKAGNNVVDHQVVNLEFEGGATVSFTMSAFTKGSRYTRIMGTWGELTTRMGDDKLHVMDFRTGKEYDVTISDCVADDTIVGGHGGGDTGIMYAFHDLMCGIENSSVCDVSVSAQNHMIAFAAERSRIEGRVVYLSEFDE